MNRIAQFVKEHRKAAGLTQEEFAMRSGLGLWFVRELEQGKETVRMDKTGIATVPHALMPLQDELAYITRRVDRIWGKNGVAMLAMEDFCQLDLRLTQDKYKGSYERCAKIIDKYSSTKGLDRAEMFMRLVFSFMVGSASIFISSSTRR